MAKFKKKKSAPTPGSDDSKPKITDGIDVPETEKSELKIIQEYLPKQLSEQDTLELIKTVITQISANSIPDIGKVMSLVMQQGGGKVDGGIANRLAKQLLQ